ncbi:MAG: prepilin-type N-terminal cleavage/methylation domain-containing protein [Bacilli bacterium]|nr:prepilin-type N-terminal cleavage/methylation domain-containing protein [Bacilli bacterium]
MKKGFTLIELLAVIIILAVIALIATPVVLNVVEEAKVKSDRNSVYGLIDAAKLYYAESLLDSDKKAYTNGTTNVLDYLVISGEGPESGKIFINDKGQSAIAVVYGKVCFTKNFNEYELSESDDIENCELDIEETPSVSYKCIRAITLHTEECTQTDSTYYCSGAGYTADGLKGTTTITYGNVTTTENVLTSGDAFDCDVNGDGIYDAATERFYYVSDLYNTTSKEVDSNYAVLIYSNNTIEGVSNTSGSAYDSSGQNWHGPVTAITNLPTTTQWSNVSLSNTSRAIITETGATSTRGGTLPTAFSYDGYSARLLTAQEVEKACNITVGSRTIGELDDTCNYLLQNTFYSNSSMPTFGPRLETPDESRSDFGLFANSNMRSVDYNYVHQNALGVRPVIEVLKTDIDY